MPRKKKHEEHENHERYLVTYSDLITLLLAFFIILYALSDVNEAKFDELAASLSIEFGSGSPELIDMGLTYRNNIRENATNEEIEMMKAASENNHLRDVQEKIDEEIEKAGLADQITTELSVEGLKIVLTDKVLFETGQATITSNHKYIVDWIGSLILEDKNPIQINGYTDNVPISNSIFPSNWELSSARSLSVLQEMIATNKNIAPSRLSASGFGEYRPIMSNETEEGRAKNRRVEIVIQRIYADGLLKPTN